MYKEKQWHTIKGVACEGCAFFDEYENEHPCCSCVDGCNFVEAEDDDQREAD